MKNTIENFPNVPVENLSDWQVIRKSDNQVFDVTSIILDEKFTEVYFGNDQAIGTTRFTPEVGGQLKNDDYEVVFKYGGDPVIDHNG